MVFIDYLTPRLYGWEGYLNDKPKLKVSFQRRVWGRWLNDAHFRWNWKETGDFLLKSVACNA